MQSMAGGVMPAVAIDHVSNAAELEGNIQHPPACRVVSPGRTKRQIRQGSNAAASGLASGVSPRLAGSASVSEFGIARDR
jgi:hypothetical protein